MKKVFTFVAAALCAVAMSAKVVTIDCVSAFSGKGTSSTGSEVTYTQDGVTFTCDKGYGDGQYGVRCYKGSTITISATQNIVKIEFEFPTVSGKYYNGGLDEVITVGAKTWTSGELPSQARLNGDLVITLSEDVEGGEGEGGEGEGGEIVVSNLHYADAYYSEGFWDFDIYNDYDYDNNNLIYPEVYFSANEEAQSKTSIVGTYTAYYAGYWKSAKDSVETDEDEPIGTLTVTCVGEYLYNFVGSFVGQDGKTYKWNATDVEVWALDYDNYEEIELTDTPTSVENTEANVQSAIKTLRNGQVLIQKNNKVYTVLGQEVK